MSSGPFHFKEAERLIDRAQRIMDGFPGDEYAQTIATAQVHATLALAAAMARPLFGDDADARQEWKQVIR